MNIIEKTAYNAEKAGIDGSKIFIKFDETDFEESETITNDKRDGVYLFVDKVEGNEVTVRIKTDDSRYWIPNHLLFKGMEWFKV